MGIPIGAIIGIAGKILKATGVLGKGKLTVAGVATTVVGTVAALVTNDNPFDAARILIDLCEKAWPQALIVIGALGTLAGYFRKAGYAAASAQQNSD